MQFLGQGNKIVIYITAYLSFDEVSLKPMRNSVILDLFVNQGHSYFDAISVRPL